MKSEIVDEDDHVLNSTQHTIPALPSSSKEQTTPLGVWTMDGLLQVNVEYTPLKMHDLILYKEHWQSGHLGN